MTSFDSHQIELGILTSPAYFEDEAAWAPVRPLTTAPLTLQVGWENHYLPTLKPSAPAGFDHALHTRMVAMSRARTRDDQGIIVSGTVSPLGYLAFGPFDSLLTLLQSVEQNEFGKTTPADYCASLCIDGEGDDLSWLNEPPSEQDHKQVQGIVERIAGIVALLDPSRAWALRVGDYHTQWHPESKLAGLKDRKTFLRRAGHTCAACGEPFDPSVETLCWVCMKRCPERS